MKTTDVKQENKKRKAGASKDLDGLSNKKPKTNHTADAKKGPIPQPKGKGRPPRASKDSATNAKVTDNPTVTTVVVAPSFNYCPTNETWQKAICGAFGLPFVKSSRPQTVCDKYGVNSKVRPRTDVTIGRNQRPGDCWYQTISHIVTGSEVNFALVKEAVLNFMQVNVTVMQDVLLQFPGFLGSLHYRDIPYSDHAAQDVIAYHRVPQTWADNIAMEMTACMLKTSYYTYNRRGGWTVHMNQHHYPFWQQRHRMLPIAEIDEMTEQSMYIFHQNRNHFVPCHTGLK